LTDLLLFKRVLVSQMWGRDEAVWIRSLFTTVYTLCAKSDGVGAYGAEKSGYDSGSQNRFGIMALFPRLQRGILQFWGDKAKIHLRELGAGTFWGLSWYKTTHKH